MKGHMRFRNGAWRLQVYAGIDPTTGRKKWVQRTVREPDNRAGTKAADKALAKLILEVEARGAEVGSDPTVAELLDRWFNAHELGWSPGTVKLHRWAIRERIVPRIGARKVSSLKRHHLNTFYGDLRREGGRKGGELAATTVRRIHVILHSAFADAVRAELIETNPAHGTELPSAPFTSPKAPTPEQVLRALREVDDDELGLFLRIAAGTGARRGQVCALRWTDIDLGAGTITYARSIAVGEKGLVEKSTKTGRVITVSVDPQLVDRLKVHRKMYVARALAASQPADGFVFVEQNGTPWNPVKVTRRWRVLADSIGLEGIELRQLRHFMITQMLGAGYDVRAVADRAGHSNPAVTLRNYAASIPQRDRDAANYLGDLLEDNTQTGGTS